MEPIDRVLKFVSKGVIAVPLAILLVALVLLNPRGNLRDKFIKPSPTPTVGVTVENLDLSSEYVCKNENLEAYVKNKKLFIKTDTKMYIYRDDCLYSWKTDTFNGEKVCGLGQYISVFENLSKLKILNINTVIDSLLPGDDKSSEKIVTVLQSCVQAEVKNSKIFDLPQDVLFKNSEKPWLRPTFPNSALE